MVFILEREWKFYVADSLAVRDQLYGTGCAIGWIRNHNIGKCTQIVFHARSFESLEEEIIRWIWFSDLAQNDQIHRFTLQWIFIL